ncbi:MAG: hypothetical protein HY784_03830, partial [Chloroflexi bacterium]|nr:hypothetical protein [Chloroflexota bacterium]
TLPLSFAVGDAVSGVQETSAYFNDQPVSDAQAAPLLAGKNTLSVYMADEAGNGNTGQVSVQVNYALTPDFPPDGQPVDRRQPLPFHFTIADACAGDGQYAGALASLWFTGPDGVEIPARRAGGGDGNQFGYDPQNRRYTFNADVSGLAPGAWTARAHLDDGNDYFSTFVIPGTLRLKR